MPTSAGRTAHLTPDGEARDLNFRSSNNQDLAAGARSHDVDAAHAAPEPRLLAHGETRYDGFVEPGAASTRVQHDRSFGKGSIVPATTGVAVLPSRSSTSVVNPGERAASHAVTSSGVPLTNVSSSRTRSIMTLARASRCCGLRIPPIPGWGMAAAPG